jgi:hypothetical protein
VSAAEIILWLLSYENKHPLWHDWRNNEDVSAGDRLLLCNAWLDAHRVCAAHENKLTNVRWLLQIRGRVPRDQSHARLGVYGVAAYIIAGMPRIASDTYRVLGRKELTGEGRRAAVARSRRATGD